MLQTYKTTLLNKTRLFTDVALYNFQLTEPETLSFLPGQYIIMMIPGKEGETCRRLYSIASYDSKKKEFELLVKLIKGGRACDYLSGLNIGTNVIFQGPAGLFTLRESPRSKAFLVTGTGYAPVRAMLLTQKETVPVTDKTINYHVFWGVPTYKEAYMLDEMKQLSANNSNYIFHICLSREQNLDMIPEEDRKYFFLGRITNGLEKLLTTDYKLLTDFDYYLCSGRDIVESLKQYLYDKGVPKEQVYFEKF